MDVMGSILLPKTLKIKYLSLGETVTDNLELEKLNHFQFPNIPPFGETNLTLELKVPENKFDSLVLYLSQYYIGIK